MTENPVAYGVVAAVRALDGLSRTSPSIGGSQMAIARASGASIYATWGMPGAHQCTGHPPIG